MFRLVPSIRISSYQNLAVNRGSLSLTIDRGTPCSRTILSRYALATVAAVVSAVSGIRCVYLLKRSITTNIVLPPYGFIGISVIKSILTCYHGLLGIGSGYNLPGNLP